MQSVSRLKFFALSLAFICANIFSSFAQLTGTYTIGGITPTYATFTLAVSDLVAVGVSGPVIFDVRDGTYPEQISIAAITGVSSTNTVTFQSESGDSSLVTITSTPSSGSNYTVQFNGCD
ncbi:MAG: hypothetical protein JKY52_17850, partial [Flavobacteriales bacterium]|nr:hypothetical protein [Flavobacteriales bacterium]